MTRVFPLLLTVCLLFWACEKEDVEREEGEQTAITLSGIDESGLLVGTAELTVEVSKEEEIEELKAYLDENLLMSLQEGPFIINFDTQAYEDGEHELKIVTVDYAGKQEETSRTVTISNVLLTVDFQEIISKIAADPAHDQIYFVVSDKDGQLISYEMLDFELAASEPVKIFSPADFYQKEFVYTLLMRDRVHESADEISLNSYWAQRGDLYQYRSAENERPTSLREFYMNFENVAPEDRMLIYGSDNSKGIRVNSTGTKFEIPVYEEQPVDYFVFTRNWYDELKSYQELPDLQAEGEIDVNVSSFKTNFETHSIGVSGAEDIEIDGYLDLSGDGTYLGWMGKLNEGTSTSYTFPSDLDFDQYLLEIFYRKEGMVFDNSIKTSSGDVSYQELNTRYTVNNISPMGATYSFTNQDFDFYVACWDNHKVVIDDDGNYTSTGGNFYWFFILPPDITEINMFELSEVVEEYSPERQGELEHHYTEIYDFTSFDSYESSQEWLRENQFSDDFGGEEFRHIYKDERDEEAGARQKSSRAQNRGRSFLTAKKWGLFK